MESASTHVEGRGERGDEKQIPEQRKGDARQTTGFVVGRRHVAHVPRRVALPVTTRTRVKNHRNRNDARDDTRNRGWSP